MLITLFIGFVLSCILGYNLFGNDGITLFVFLYFILAILLLLLKYIFFPKKNKVYTSYISDLWKRIFNRFYVFIILFLPGFIAYSDEYITLQSKINAYFLTLMFLFYIGIIVFILRVIIKTIFLTINKFINVIDPRIEEERRNKP